MQCNLCKQYISRVKTAKTVLAVYVAVLLLSLMVFFLQGSVYVFVQLFVVTRHRHNTPSGGCEWEGIRWHLLKHLSCVFQYLHACLCFCVFVSVFVHLFVITGHRQVVGSGTMAKPLAQGAASLETVTLPLLLLHLYMHCSPDPI